ncbi:hypothetical protein ACF08N_05495 [Streptomyces sp. NPDC015127]|uniref:hypothetical protein n=1 Tax=Streptomyces sp. NPDC015127 TaxID=3364939 RepID=UPI0037001CD0
MGEQMSAAAAGAVRPCRWCGRPFRHAGRRGRLALYCRRTHLWRRRLSDLVELVTDTV